MRRVNSERMGWRPDAADGAPRPKSMADMSEPEVTPIAANGRWQEVDRSRKKGEKVKEAVKVVKAEEVDDSPETVAEREPDDTYDQWVDYLTKPKIDEATGLEIPAEMSELGRLNIDAQVLFDKYPGLTKEALDEISSRARSRNAPVRRSRDEQDDYRMAA